MPFCAHHAPRKGHHGLGQAPYQCRSKVSLPIALYGAATSVTKLANTLRPNPNSSRVHRLDQDAALLDAVSSKFDRVISCIDNEAFSGKEEDLALTNNLPSPPTDSRFLHSTLHTLSSAASPFNYFSKANYYSKSWLYYNSRLPPDLPPLKLHSSDFALVCLAARYSERVYEKPSKRSEAVCSIPSDFRRGTKPMLLKSVPLDDVNAIVFAIRGSDSILDWCVNYKTEPTSPHGFLDDAGNLCHAGFLRVARKTAPMIADRLKALLREEPGRRRASLLICGHSAGGAVAQLLYAHMMSWDGSVGSELKLLTREFERVHCVTFGAPPVSLLPLQVGERAGARESWKDWTERKSGGGKEMDEREEKSLFLAFMNEGDPVVRGDKEIMRSLFKLYISWPPSSAPAHASGGGVGDSGAVSNWQRLRNVKSSAALATAAAIGIKDVSKLEQKPHARTTKGKQPDSALPLWHVPPGTLSLSGRLVLLRDRAGASKDDDVDAFTVSDELMRAVVFGDMLRHMMSLYTRRVESLAPRAVTGTS